jgi:HSP90 family molecular chaperone
MNRMLQRIKDAEWHAQDARNDAKQAREERKRTKTEFDELKKKFDDHLVEYDGRNKVFDAFREGHISLLDTTNDLAINTAKALAVTNKSVNAIERVLQVDSDEEAITHRLAGTSKGPAQNIAQDSNEEIAEPQQKGKTRQPKTTSAPTKQT